MQHGPEEAVPRRGQRGVHGIDPVRNQHVPLGRQVCGRKPETPAPAPSRNHRAVDLVKRSEERGARFDVPLCQGPPDPGGRDDRPLPRDGRRLDDPEPVAVAEGAEGFEIARAAAAEPEIRTLHHGDGPEPLHEQPGNEIRGRSSGHRLAELEHDEALHSGVREPLRLEREAGDGLRSPVGTKQPGRMGIEGHRDTLGAAGSRLLPGELQSHPVTPVDPVEVADRDDGRSRRRAGVRRGWQLAEALDSHVRIGC